MPYIVVFEYDKTMGGSYGTRFIIEYATKEAFDSRENKNDGTIIVAEGISQDEAQDLVALTPEICVALASLEEAYRGRSSLSTTRTRFAFDNAMIKIAMQQKRIADRNLTRPNITAMMDHFYETFLNDNGFLGFSKRMILVSASVFTGQITTLR